MNTPEYIADWQRRAALMERRSSLPERALRAVVALLALGLVLGLAYGFGRVHQAAIDTAEQAGEAR